MLTKCPAVLVAQFEVRAGAGRLTKAGLSKPDTFIYLYATVDDDLVALDWIALNFGSPIDSFNVSTTLSGSTATLTVDSGNDQIDFSATFGTNSLSGTFVGPLCTVAAGRYRGTFTGQRQ